MTQIAITKNLIWREDDLLGLEADLRAIRDQYDAMTAKLSEALAMRVVSVDRVRAAMIGLKLEIDSFLKVY